jgi:hypothetical protein
MRKILLAGVVLALSACGGGNKSSNSANASGTNMTGADSMSMNQPMTADQNSALNSVNSAAADGSIDSNTQNAMMKDATTHDADTNLANGM